MIVEQEYVKKPPVVKVREEIHKVIVFVKMKLVFGMKEQINVLFHVEINYIGLKEINVWNCVMQLKD